MSETTVAGSPAPASRLTLTARLNTSALDSRRGVVRLHPEAIAALGIREWDAVSLTGSRTTAAVAGVAPPGTPAGTALLDDVTLTFAPGETTKTITIVVKGDKLREANETFYLDLFGNSTNSWFTKNRGIGTILNDDKPTREFGIVVQDTVPQRPAARQRLGHLPKISAAARPTGRP